MRLNSRPLPILIPAEMELIHSKTVELLESPGICIEHDGFLDALEAHGASIEREKRIARIPSKITEQAARAICGSPCLLEDSAESVEQALSERFRSALSQPFSFRFGGAGVEVLEDDMRTIRKARFADLEKVVRFGNGHPRIATIGGPPLWCAFEADDTPIQPALRPIAGMAYAAKHCAKLGWNEIASVDDIAFATRLGELLVGEEAHRANPFFLCVKCSISPLKIGADAASILYELARRRLPVGIAPMPLAGGTSPVTPASAILLINAEILGMMTAIWALGEITVQEHLPLSAVMDMQTAIASFSNPNAVLQDAGAAQLWSAFYGLKVHAATDYIDAKFPGFQSGMERAFKIATSVAAGSIYPSIGQLRSGLVCSCEQACLDIEAFDWMRHFLRGVEVSEESLAVNLIRERGIGGHFLDAEHTVSNFRDELYLPELADRFAAENRDMVEAAREQVNSILERTPLFSRDSALCREVDRCYQREIDRRRQGQR